MTKTEAHRATPRELVIKYLLELAEKDGQQAVKIGCSAKVAKEIQKNGVLEVLKERKQEVIEYLQDKEAARKQAADEQAAKEKQERENIIVGKTKIQAYWQDGEYYQGYSICWQAQQITKDLKIGKNLSGWGFALDSEVVKALGEEFTYQQLVDYAQPALDASAAKKAKAEADKNAKFEQARQTREQVLLRKWSEPCNDPREECSLDMVYEYAMPNGTTKIVRYHTW